MNTRQYTNQRVSDSKLLALLLWDRSVSHQTPVNQCTSTNVIQVPSLKVKLKIFSIVPLVTLSHTYHNPTTYRRMGNLHSQQIIAAFVVVVAISNTLGINCVEYIINHTHGISTRLSTPPRLSARVTN